MKKVHLKNIMLPSEHGGWSLVLEPVVLGLLVAYSFLGLLLGLSFFFLFLLRHPLRTVIGDLKKNRKFPRTNVAGIISIIYFLLSASFFMYAIILSGKNLIFPMLFALPFFLTYILIDIIIQKRSLLSELSGPVALGSVSASIALADGWSLLPALGLWMIIIFRILPSIIYIRARLELERGNKINRMPALTLHLAVIILALILIQYQMIPMLVIPALLILFIRSYIGLSDFRKPTYVQKIGYMEIAYGAMTIFIVAAGYIF